MCYHLTEATAKILLAELAVDYLKKKAQHPSDCPIWALDEGEEVVEFTAHFQCWQPALCETRRKHVVIGPPVFAVSRSPLVTASQLSAKRGAKFSLKELCDRDFLPEGVDAKELERFLRVRAFERLTLIPLCLATDSAIALFD